MKATGIVRRIDELGRVVIPKEIRRTFKIRQGEPLEIFVEQNGEVILKKYSPVAELGNFAQDYANSLYEAIGNVVCIADRDKVIAVAGAPRKEFVHRTLGPAVEQAMRTRQSMLINDTSPPDYYLEGNEGTAAKFYAQVIAPIISAGDCIGAVILGTMERDVKMGELELKLAETAAGFIAKQTDY